MTHKTLPEVTERLQQLAWCELADASLDEDEDGLLKQDLSIYFQLQYITVDNAKRYIAKNY